MTIKDNLLFLLEKIKVYFRKKDLYYIKQLTLRKIKYSYGYSKFVETGTFVGSMIDFLKSDFDQIYSCELKKELYEMALNKFKYDKHGHLYLGDSAERLVEIINQINEPSLFWLDAHYSGEGTGRKSTDTPIVKEISIVLDSPYSHYLLIDDADYFNGKNSYLTLDDLKKMILAKRKLKLFKVRYNMINIILESN